MVAFKRELATYRDIEEEIRSFDEEIQYCYDMLGASPRSVDPGRVVVHSPPNKEREYELRERISLLEANRSPWLSKKKRIDRILMRMETSLREDVVHVYVDNEKLDVVSAPRYVTASTLHYRLNKAIENALDEEHKKTHLL